MSTFEAGHADYFSTDNNGTAFTWNRLVHDPLAACTEEWNTWVPRVARFTNGNLTTIIPYARYIKVGKWVRATFDVVVVDATGSYGNSPLGIQFPGATPDSSGYVPTWDQSESYGVTPIGTGQLYNGSAWEPVIFTYQAAEIVAPWNWITLRQTSIPTVTHAVGGTCNYGCNTSTVSTPAGIEIRGTLNYETQGITY